MGFGMGPTAVICILALGVLFFGKDLPGVARQVGLGLMELKRGMNELKGTFDVGSLDSPGPPLVDRSDEGAAPLPENQESIGTKFEPPQET